MKVYINKIDADTAKVSYRFSGWRDALAALGETEAQQEEHELRLLKAIRSAPIGKSVLQ